MDERKQERHESYGMLQINRTHHGKETNLFGSSILHRDTIRLSIHPGVLERHLHQDWHYAESREYIEVEMSQSQFAEAITNMNNGSGIPVTIRRLDGKFIEEPPHTSKRLQFEEEFKQRMEEFAEKLDTITEETEELLKNKKSINKGDRTKILNTFHKFKTEIASNIPFMSASYNEQLDKTTHEAKSEIEAFTIQKINQLGIEKLNELTSLPSSANKYLDE